MRTSQEKLIAKYSDQVLRRLGEIEEVIDQVQKMLGSSLGKIKSCVL